jgi:hypothetical protein
VRERKRVPDFIIIIFKEFKKQNVFKDKLLFPNFYEDSSILELAGVGFSEEESFKIAASVRKLAD